MSAITRFALIDWKRVPRMPVSLIPASREEVHMSVVVNRPAPDFTAAAVLGDGSIGELKLSDFRGKKYVVLFFWPLDFTFVCPSEIIAHENRRKAFEQRGVQLIGVSIDSQFTHYAWRQTPVNKGGIGAIGFPMVADVTHAITQAYGIEHPQDGV